ncbi:heat-inducible transcriptional repressor HrcA [Clostridium sp. CTA-19]|uniref:Heat-inducible transcription repressor HrcA n=2 Tax=Clostridiaceae TaxID=31979 RepID=A0A6M0GZQ3_9CLOT|nr:heat-inducible transcriptional repressor HrcA [Clostridium senegalense]
MKMDDRKIYILQAIIHDYITCGEPVGSRTIAKKYDLGISSATIRNEMADLEDMGYLEQLHTSSGRKPSDKGYRLYVDNLMKISNLTSQEKAIIKKSIIDMACGEIDRIIMNATEILSDLTKLTSIVKAPSLRKSTLRHVQLSLVDNNNVLATMITNSGVIRNNIIKITKPIDSSTLLKLNNVLNEKLRDINIEDISLEFLLNIKRELKGNEEILDAIIPILYGTLINEENSKIYIKGSTNIFNYQEYNDIEKAKDFLNFLNNNEFVKSLLDQNKENGLAISIGKENFNEYTKQCSIITATYNYNGIPLGTIGVIGPTRIPYGKVVGILNTLVDELNFNIEEIYKKF